MSLACDGKATEGPLLVDAVVAFPPRDTVRFSLPATTHHCSDGRSLLLEAVSPEGSGVLVRLRYRDSLVAARYRVVVPGDTTAPAAVVIVRYLLRDVAHTFAFDTGAVVVRRGVNTLGGHVQGSGIENAIRTPTTIDYRDVPLTPASDTVSCAIQP